MKVLQKDNLTVKIMPTRDEMGKIAAEDIRNKIISLLSKKDELNMIFAAAPSQNDVLAHLTAYRDIDWSRINAFHMDEYIGLSDRSKSFGAYLNEHIFGKVPFKSVNYIDSSSTDYEGES